MYINELLKRKNMTQYQVARQSGVPYMTLHDICSGKTRLEKCSADTVYKLANTLGVTMEMLLEPYVTPRPAFELFKSETCHRLKEMGDVDFLIEKNEKGSIPRLFEMARYPESLYLLAMVDYLSRINGIPICDAYADIRKTRLQAPLYPSGILLEDAASGSDRAREQAKAAAIPEFLRFNIIEREVRDVI